MNIKKGGGGGVGGGGQQNQTAEPKADKCAISHFSLSNCCLTVVLRMLCFVVINSILLTFKKSFNLRLIKLLVIVTFTKFTVSKNKTTLVQA